MAKPLFPESLARDAGPVERSRPTRRKQGGTPRGKACKPACPLSTGSPPTREGRMDAAGSLGERREIGRSSGFGLFVPAFPMRASLVISGCPRELAGCGTRQHPLRRRVRGGIGLSRQQTDRPHHASLLGPERNNRPGTDFGRSVTRRDGRVNRELNCSTRAGITSPAEHARRRRGLRRAGRDRPPATPASTSCLARRSPSTTAGRPASNSP